jgi:hypothetical protein
VELILLPCLLPSSSKSLDRQNIDPEEQDDDRLVDVDATPPPLGVKLTGCRLVSMTTVLSCGIVKSILAYKGQSIAPTTLDWVAGTSLTVA